MLKNKNIAIYVTGSIAAYKALILCRLLIKAQAHVKIVMTTAAQKFVTPLSFQTLSKHRVLTDAFDSSDPKMINHVALAKWTDLAIVAPASANLIGKMAQGIADDFASLALMTTSAVKLVAPAMNDQMWASCAVQRNLKILKDDGVKIIQPAKGFLAEGYEGKGRMAEPEELIAQIDANLVSLSPIKGQRIIVTAGGTHERIDPIRFLGNDSSGKMGYAVAKVLQQKGALVTLISAPTNLKVPVGVKLIKVTSAKDMHDAVLAEFPKSRILVMAAAVADFTCANPAQYKLKKNDIESSWSLELTKTADILIDVAKIKQPHQITVGFAAETQNLLMQAEHKLKQKQLDLIVANDVSKPQVGFNSETNQVTLIDAANNQTTTELLPKIKIAEILVDKIIDIFQRKP